MWWEWKKNFERKHDYISYILAFLLAVQLRGKQLVTCTDTEVASIHISKQHCGQIVKLFKVYLYLVHILSSIHCHPSCTN